MPIDDQLDRCWPWLAAAATRGRERGLTKTDLRDRLLGGQAMLWPGDDGALVTQCLIMPDGRFVHCWLGGGALRALLSLRPGVEAWGRAMGCDYASIDGRKGWDRVFQPLGYLRIGNELRKPLMSSSKTTTNSQTVTPTNPAWLDQSTQTFANGLANLAQQPVSSVAAPTTLTNQQFDLGGALGAQGANWLNQAAGLAGGAGQAYGYNPATSQAAQIGGTAHAQAASALGGISNYLNPYQGAVVDSTLSDLDRARQMAQEGNGQGAILAGQYGGSRQGVADALTNSEFFRNVGSTVGNLNAQGFNTAAGLSNQDADRTQQASIFNAGADNAQTLAQAQMQQQTNLANQSADNQAWQYNAGANDTAASRQLQGAQLLSGLGQAGLGDLNSAAGVQQAIAQAQAASPYTSLEQLAAAYSGLPLKQFTGETTNGTTKETTSDPFAELQKAIKVAGAVVTAPATGGTSLLALGAG